MPLLAASTHDERHWLLVCAMISGSPGQPAAWALLIAGGVGLSFWIGR